MRSYQVKKYISCFIIFSLIAAFSMATRVSAQVVPPPLGVYDASYFYNPFLYGYNPFLAFPPAPLLPTAPLLYPPYPTFNPYLATLPTTVSRTGAATLILTPAAPVVTAAAPLGTLSLTPSTLVFLILLATLAE